MNKKKNKECIKGWKAAGYNFNTKHPDLDEPPDGEQDALHFIAMCISHGDEECIKCIEKYLFNKKEKAKEEAEWNYYNSALEIIVAYMSDNEEVSKMVTDFMIKHKMGQRKIHFGSRGGVYYKRNGRKVYVTNRFGLDGFPSLPFTDDMSVSTASTINEENLNAARVVINEYLNGVNDLDQEIAILKYFSGENIDEHIINLRGIVTDASIMRVAANEILNSLYRSIQ